MYAIRSYYVAGRRRRVATLEQGRRVGAGREAFASLGEIRGAVEIMELDLASLASVRRFAENFLAIV